MVKIFSKATIAFSGLFLCSTLTAQTLQPGFDADEYIGVLKRCAEQSQLGLQQEQRETISYKKVYTSPEAGMHNQWELWLSKDKSIMAINLRGTIGSIDSWLENFYSAMIPATGYLLLNGKDTVRYKFANNPKASVHTGWAIGICSLLPDITDKINTWYARGVKQILVEGHSQGAALSFLLSACLHYRQTDGTLPKDIVIKTYCSAAPKPGNLYFAYDFDYVNRGGWAFTIMNAADWVPEMPFSVQTTHDVNLNPFAYTNKSMSKKLFVRLYTKHMYNSLDRHTRKAERKNDKFLGRVLYTQVKKYVKGMKQPDYSGSCNYAQAGTPIVLMPDAAYYKKFPDTGRNIFRNHLFEPYYYLVKKEYTQHP